MADEILSRDQNHVTVLGGVTDDSNLNVTMLRVDPTTKRLKISGVVTGAGSGDVVGPNGATDGHLAVFDGATGKLIKDGGAPGGLTVGTTTISSGTTARILYDNSGVLGEYTLTGSGTVVAMATAAVLTSPTITTKISPTSDDGAPLGDTTHNFSDLYLASGAVINFNNGNVGITHNNAGTFLLVNPGDFRVTSANVGTNADSVPTLSSTSTLTNKTLTSPILVTPTLGVASASALTLTAGALKEKVVTITDGAGAVIDASLGNLFTWTAGADRTAGTTTNPTSGQKIVICFIASGGARTLTLPTSTTGDFAYGSDITVLTQTASGKGDMIGCIYGLPVANRWNVVAYVKGY